MPFRLPLNDERLGILCGNHVRSLIRMRTGLSRFQGITCGLRAKGYYAIRISKERYALRQQALSTGFQDAADAFKK